MTSGTSPEASDTCLPESSAPIVNRIVALSRWMFLFAVLGTVLASVTLFIYGFAFTVMTVMNAFTIPHFDRAGIKELMALLLEVIGLFLVATVFFIISLGLYELFIAKAPLPGWLKICNLDDLRSLGSWSSPLPCSSWGRP
jgi:uncharacterized membrane protein YqhA